MDKVFAIYSRKSKFTGKGESVENQIEMCRDYLKMHSGEEEAEKAIVFEDEGCVIPEGKRELFESVPGEFSQLYLSVGGLLTAVICIEDQLRPEAADVIRRFHMAGVEKNVMMTGDSKRTAEAVAAKVGYMAKCGKNSFVRRFF